MNSFKKTVVASLLISGAMLAGAVQAGTTVTVVVENQTASTAVYTSEMFSGSVSPLPGDIKGYSVSNFTLSNGTDIASGMRFSYTVGTKACLFSASHLGKPSMGSYIPSWKKEARSTGRVNATCTAVITKANANLPFDYAVKFTIK